MFQQDKALEIQCPEFMLYSYPLKKGISVPPGSYIWIVQKNYK